ncbi:unnamed protein product [Lupinus luteus]|uniref:Phytocyanin domain-containing protein n=1 Tax=Lupinus luteus TaxID=3873 RepID=A0AAV1W9E2_LUPLU
MAKALALCLMVMFIASPTVFGVDHIVGDSGGWSLGNDFTTWASGKTFKVGDNLVFIYDSSHQVDQVDESGYKGCSASNSINNYQDGNSKVPLTTSGNVYFICPIPGHCAGGMKLQLNVVVATSTTTPSGGSPPTTPGGGSPPTTPSGGSTPTTPSNPSPYTPSGSGTPPATTSPKPSGAVTVSSGISHFIFVSAIVLGFITG